MPTAKELYEEWTSGDETGMRPHRLKEVRADMQEETGLSFPRGVAALESFQRRMKPQITRALREAIGYYDEEDDPEDGENETDDVG